MPDPMTVLPRTLKRIGSTADEFRPLYDMTDGKEGYVSLKVNSHLAHDTNGTTEEARWVLERLPELGISIDHVTRQLEDEGVEKFDKPFDKLMETLSQRSPRHLTRES
jgi:transaldolase